MVRLILAKMRPCPNCGSHDFAIGHVVTDTPKKWFCECKVCYWCSETKLTCLGAQIAWNRQKAGKKKNGDV